MTKDQKAKSLYVLHIVAEWFNIQPSVITSKKKLKKYVYARNVATKLLNKYVTSEHDELALILNKSVDSIKHMLSTKGQGKLGVLSAEEITSFNDISIKLDKEFNVVDSSDIIKFIPKPNDHIKEGDLVRILNCYHVDVRPGKLGIVKKIFTGEQGYGVEVRGKFSTLGEGNALIKKSGTEEVFVEKGKLEVPTTEEILKVLLEL